MSRAISVAALDRTKKGPRPPCRRITWAGDSLDSDRNRRLEHLRERESAKKFSDGESSLYATVSAAFAREKLPVGVAR
jgi:hypothetical protein